MERFRELLKKKQAYSYALNIIGWDSATEAPKDCFEYRAEMSSILSGEVFKLSTSSEYISVVEELYEARNTLSENDKREIVKAKKALDKILKIPQDEYIAYSKLLSTSERKWEEAKSKSDYSLFKDLLKEIIEYQRKFVSYFEIDDHPYNIMLDDFEEGMNMEKYDLFFDTLKSDLVPFVKDLIKNKKQFDESFITRFYDKNKQKEFSEYLLDVFAFNQDKGVLKESVHPFTWNTHPSDVRLTTRYLENFMFSSIFATIHELGHATYEQQISEEFNNTLLKSGTTMGIHESQSRFYENIIGRCDAFWEVHYPKLKEIFAEELKDVDLETFILGINNVDATLIRVEADELTYPMHIMIRYDIERMIFNNEVEVDDLPKVWDDLYMKYLGIKADDISDGVLQDVHWAAGLFGYFPTYALGSAYAAQFYYTMINELDLDQLIKDNNIKAINDYLKDKIHKYGGSKTPEELLLEVTKEEFNPKYYVKFLKEKYSKLFL